MVLEKYSFKNSKFYKECMAHKGERCVTSKKRLRGRLSKPLHDHQTIKMGAIAYSVS